MSYKVTTPEKVMAHEFTQIEGNLAQVDQQALKSITPKGMNSDTFLDKIAQGDYLLLTDFPITPLVIASTDKDNLSDWVINEDVESFYQPSGLTTLKNRINITSQHGTSSPAYNGSLHAARELVYSPEPPVDSSVEKTAPIAYEYNMEIAFSSGSPSYPVRLNAKLTNSNDRWTEEKTAKGSKYTIKTNANDPRDLQFLVHKRMMGISLKNVEMVTLGAGTVNDAFLPIMPAIQYGERLALTASGYLYHFKGDQLVQEYKWVGKEGFSPLAMTESEDAFNQTSTSLLVHWKIAGEVITDQSLVYRNERLTEQEKSDITQAWLDENGVHLDIEALLEIPSAELMTRDEDLNEEDTSQQTNATPTKITHTVKADAATGQRESITNIAAQYGITTADLMQQNASYANDLSAIKIGTTLTIPQAKTADAPISFEPFECPPEAPSTYNSPQNSHYKCKNGATSLSPSLPIFPLNQQSVKNGLPLVNIKPERIFRIGMFFDGTGNNLENDTYKEEYGDHSRTNIARLFDAYPEEAGKVAKIYVSGVGTLDIKGSDAEKKNILDAGEDMLKPSLATGLFDIGGAHVKWQSLLSALKNIIDGLKKDNLYNDITHIAFDVFGFSRGAALARHFINAVIEEGLPDYDKERDADPFPLDLENTEGPLHPNLLGGVDHESYNPYESGYEVDTNRTASVRFVGLLDTVGSFYLPGNDDEGDFKLSLAPDCAQRVVHLTAHGEYRSKFPLTSLKTNGRLPPNFFEEVFPGAHSDVGGGYPFKKSYGNQSLANIFKDNVGKSATKASYRLELIKTESINNITLTRDDKITMVTPSIEGMRSIKINTTLNNAWNNESLDQYNIYGRVTHDANYVYYYHLHPIDGSLAGLTQERLKQQAELVGIKWNEDEYIQTKDYSENKNVTALWKKLATVPLGTIQPKDWQEEIAPIAHQVVHSSHGLATHVGFDSFLEVLVNGVDNNDKYIQRTPDQMVDTPIRNIYDNA